MHLFTQEISDGKCFVAFLIDVKPFVNSLLLLHKMCSDKFGYMCVYICLCVYVWVLCVHREYIFLYAENCIL